MPKMKTKSSAKKRFKVTGSGKIKRKNAEKFLKEGAKLKAFVFFKGRSIIYKEQGQILLLRLAQDLEDHGKVEALPVLEGKRMIMYIAPKKKK